MNGYSFQDYILSLKCAEVKAVFTYEVNQQCDLFNTKVTQKCTYSTPFNP